MACRTYDRVLPCGCMISSDGGGGLISCCYLGFGATEEEVKKCNDSWDEWQRSDDYEKYLEEVSELND